MTQSVLHKQVIGREGAWSGERVWNPSARRAETQTYIPNMQTVTTQAEQPLHHILTKENYFFLNQKVSTQTSKLNYKLAIKKKTGLHKNILYKYHQPLNLFGSSKITLRSRHTETYAIFSYFKINFLHILTFGWYITSLHRNDSVYYVIVQTLNFTKKNWKLPELFCNTTNLHFPT